MSDGFVVSESRGSRLRPARSRALEWAVIRLVALRSVLCCGALLLGTTAGSERCGLRAQTRFAPSGNHVASVLDFMTAGLALVDVDRDQDLDLVVVNGSWTGWEPARLYRNDGNGRMELAQGTFPTLLHRGTSVAAGDLDRDGDVDLVIGNFGLGLQGVQNRIFLNDGSGGYRDGTAEVMPLFAAHCRHLELSPATRGVALCDVDRDGDLDLICANWCQNRLYRNDGSGKLVDATVGALPVDADASNAVAVGDVDGDGDPDLVFGNAQADTVASRANKLYLNDGFGRFDPAPAGWLPPDLDETNALALADFDGDGDLDLVTANSSSQFSAVGATDRFYRNDGSGRFTDATQEWLPPSGSDSFAVVAHDLDLDGRLDLIFGCSEATYGALDRALRNTGSGFVERSAAWLPRTVDQTFSLAAGDLDRDGDPDLVVGNRGQNILLFNRHRHVDGGVARIGEAYPIRVWAEPGELQRGQLARVLVGTAQTWTRLEPFGWVGIDPAGRFIELPLQVVRAPQGMVQYDYQVPDSAGLHGLEFCIQALILPDQLRFTNVWRDHVR